MLKFIKTRTITNVRFCKFFFFFFFFSRIVYFIFYREQGSGMCNWISLAGVEHIAHKLQKGIRQQTQNAECLNDIGKGRKNRLF